MIQLKIEPRPWVAKAACDGLGDTPFFDDIWTVEEDGTEVGPDEEALATARAICASCPTRLECFVDVMDDEEGYALSRRAGFRAGLTPAQRYSIWRRDVVRCIQCREVYDPMGVAAGEVVCECGEFTEEPVPDEGDTWYPRHDVLLKKLVTYLVENTKPGDRILPPYRMMRELGHRRKDDMPVCYERLIDDGLIVRGERVGEYYRSGSHRALVSWVPAHRRRNRP